MVEAVEDLTTAIVDARLLASPTKKQLEVADNRVRDARLFMSRVLKEFLQPTLRLIENDGRPQPYVDGTPSSDMPMCETCLRKTPCTTVCDHWAAAVRRMRQLAHD